MPHKITFVRIARVFVFLSSSKYNYLLFF